VGNRKNLSFVEKERKECMLQMTERRLAVYVCHTYTMQE
jgi:hypothetical protein